MVTEVLAFMFFFKVQTPDYRIYSDMHKQQHICVAR